MKNKKKAKWTTNSFKIGPGVGGGGLGGRLGKLKIFIGRSGLISALQMAAPQLFEARTM